MQDMEAAVDELRTTLAAMTANATSLERQNEVRHADSSRLLVACASQCPSLLPPRAFHVHKRLCKGLCTL